MAAPRSFGWDECLSWGDVGVGMLTRHLLRHRHQIEDVTAGKLWRKRDVDLLVDGHMVEVKTDSHPSKNIFLELTTGDKPGWAYLSRADWLVIVFPKEKLAYWINLPQLQFWLASHKGDYKPVIIRSHRSHPNGTSRWEYVGIAVPVIDLAKAGVEFKTIRFDEEEAQDGRGDIPDPESEVGAGIAG